jgi:hypothetical protein
MYCTCGVQRIYAGKRLRCIVLVVYRGRFLHVYFEQIEGTDQMLVANFMFAT